jgi:hypothetical protein
MEHPRLISSDDCLKSPHPLACIAKKCDCLHACLLVVIHQLSRHPPIRYRPFGNLDAHEKCPILCSVKDATSIPTARETCICLPVLLHQCPQHVWWMWMVTHSFVHPLCLPDHFQIPDTTYAHVALPLYWDHRLSQAHDGFPQAGCLLPRKNELKTTLFPLSTRSEWSPLFTRCWASTLCLC